MTCVFIDSRREPTSLDLSVFDDAGICTKAFASSLFRMMKWSNDQTATYLILRPDPVHYFLPQFQKFPALVFDAGDSPEAYIEGLNSDPGESPIDAVGTNWWECVIVPSSLRWFVHALRSDDNNGGHLWAPREWRGRLRDEGYFH